LPAIHRNKRGTAGSADVCNNRGRSRFLAPQQDFAVLWPRGERAPLLGIKRIVRSMHYEIYSDIDTMLSPEVLGTLVGLPITSVRVRPYDVDSGSGNGFLVVETGDGLGQRYIVKRLSAERDWSMRATDDRHGREVVMSDEPSAQYRLIALLRYAAAALCQELLGLRPEFDGDSGSNLHQAHLSCVYHVVKVSIDGLRYSILIQHGGLPLRIHPDINLQVVPLNTPRMDGGVTGKIEVKADGLPIWVKPVIDVVVAVTPVVGVGQGPLRHLDRRINVGPASLNDIPEDCPLRRFHQTRLTGELQALSHELVLNLSHALHVVAPIKGSSTPAVASAAL